MKRSSMLAFAGVVSMFFAANAHAQTVSAHGTGVVSGQACDFTGVCPDFGGKGVKFSFSFSGTGTGFAVPVTGTWSASEADTGVQVQFVMGAATVFPSFHQIFVSGTCTVTTPTGGTLLGGCSFVAVDATPNGAVDQANLFVSAGNGFISAFGELASGNNSID
jgi:hypothetical protein